VPANGAGKRVSCRFEVGGPRPAPPAAPRSLNAKERVVSSPYSARSEGAETDGWRLTVAEWLQRKGARSRGSVRLRLRPNCEHSVRTAPAAARRARARCGAGAPCVRGAVTHLRFKGDTSPRLTRGGSSRATSPARSLHS
jgi:hypothetical protein